MQLQSRMETMQFSTTAEACVVALKLYDATTLQGQKGVSSETI